MTQGASIGSSMKGSAPRGSGSPTRAAQPLSTPPRFAALKAEGSGATEIAKRLKIGRASVYRLLLGPRGWGRLNEREIATPRDGRLQTRSDAFA
jgi:DNA invertase Pin-like site-specific DNA recombinase